MTDSDNISSGNAGFSSSSHCACIFKTEREQFSTTVPFMLAGLNRGDKCFYIFNETSEDDILDAIMREENIERHVDDGDIAFLSTDDVYLKGGRFDADRMLSFVRQAEQKALAEGYSGLTATGEMSWHKANATGSDQLMEYEARLNDVYSTSNPELLCQYDEQAFDHSVLLDAIRTHPRVILNGELCVNPYYTPPDEFLSMRNGVIPREIYERTNADILKRASLSMIHRMEMRDFRRARRKLSALDDFGLCEIQSLIEIVSFYNDLARDSCNDPIALSHLDVVSRKCGQAQKHMSLLRAYQSVDESEPMWRRLGTILESVRTGVDCNVAVFGSEGDSIEILVGSLFNDAIKALVEKVPDLQMDTGEVSIKVDRSENDLVISIENADGSFADQSDDVGWFLVTEMLSSSGVSVRKDGIAGRCAKFEILIPEGKHRVASQ